MNGARPAHRDGLRAYAIELLRDGTESGDARSEPGAGSSAGGAGTNPIGLALLLGVLGLPALLLFPPVGLALLAVATVMGLWGVLAVVLQRAT